MHIGRRDDLCAYFICMSCRDNSCKRPATVDRKLSVRHFQRLYAYFNIDTWKLCSTSFIHKNQLLADYSLIWNCCCTYSMEVFSAHQRNCRSVVHVRHLKYRKNFSVSFYDARESSHDTTCKRILLLDQNCFWGHFFLISASAWTFIRV